MGAIENAKTSLPRPTLGATAAQPADARGAVLAEAGWRDL